MTTLDKLTDREAEIVKLLCKGHTYNDVALMLYIELCTVKTHVNNIFRKLEVSSLPKLLALVFYYREKELLEAATCR